MKGRSIRKNHNVNSPRRPGMALVMTLLIIVLLIAATSRLATTAAVAKIRSNIRSNTLQHEVAVDSMLLVAAHSVNIDAAHSTGQDFLRRNGLKRDSALFLTDRFGDCTVSCRIVSDAGKLNVNAFSRREDRSTLRRKLRRIAQQFAMPAAQIRSQPVRKRRIERADGSKINLPAYVSYDQLFGERAIDAVYSMGGSTGGGIETGSPAWSEVVTVFGDGRVALRYVQPEVLRVLLDDIDPRAASQLLAHRREVGAKLDLTWALAKVDENRRDDVRKRIGLDIERYAITIDTVIHNDQRRWYIVADLQGGRVTKIHHRGRITW